MVFQHCPRVGHMIMSCYLIRLSHFKILKVADDVLFGSNSTLMNTVTVISYLKVLMFVVQYVGNSLL
jgi:hypothetical protein